jgi:hypothetical protein
MKLKKLCYAAAVVLAACWVHNASAQDSHWSGLGSGGLWSDPNNWTPVGVPQPESGLSGNPTSGGNVFLDAANGWSVITIANGDVETPGVGGANPPWNTIYGPEFGASLHIYGSLTYDWIMAPAQNDPAPGNRSLINMYGSSSLTTQGAALGLGDQWWYWDAPYVTMNMYNSSQALMQGGAGLWLGGHLNIYDTATFTIQGYLNMDVQYAISDGTRSLVLGGGTLVLPTGWTAPGGAGENSGTVYDWIGRGILRAYGKGYDTNDLVITDNGTNTTVTTVALGGALSQIYFQSLLQSTMMEGTFQQATLVGDYPSVTGVLLSSAEPGLDPATFAPPAYTSSNPNVVTVDANGMVTAVNPGSATLTATVGALTSINTLSVTVTPVLCSTNTLVHRYSFSESSGTTTADSVPGNSPTWDGTLIGGATLGGGQVTLDGASGYVQLPAGLVSGLDEVTVEIWASFGSPINTFANLFAFGNTDTDPLDSTYGDGGNAITLSPHTGGLTTSANFAQGLPGFNGERDAVITGTQDGQANMQLVVVYHPLAGYEAVYRNGVLGATISMFNNMIDPVAYNGPTYNKGSILAYTLGADPLNYIGKSLYNADPTLNGSVDEVRIYKGPLTAGQILADHALGPNQLIGTSTNVSLSASVSGGNVVISWPTTSALVDLISSPVLGPGAVWTPVSNGSLVVVGGNYQMTIPVTGSARFFRLQL